MVLGAGVAQVVAMVMAIDDDGDDGVTMTPDADGGDDTARR
jgi:hypothetical protein